MDKYSRIIGISYCLGGNITKRHFKQQGRHGGLYDADYALTIIVVAKGTNWHMMLPKFP